MEFTCDRKSYTDAKTELIEGILRKDGQTYMGKMGPMPSSILTHQFLPEISVSFPLFFSLPTVLPLLYLFRTFDFL